MPLIPYEDVRGFLPTQDFGADQLAAAMKLVASDLRDAITPAQLPPELPEDHELYGPAFRLVVMEITNPEGVTSRGYGPKTRTYASSAERRAILDGVRERYRQAAVAPAGCFPPPQSWPESTVAPWPTL